MKSSVKKNYFYNVLYTIVNMLLPLITAPYLARVLGVNGVGQYAYAFSIAQYFVLIAKLGLVNYGTREISKEKDKEKKSLIFSNLFYMQILSTIIVSMIYLFYIFALSGEQKNISFIFFFWIFLSFFDIDWFWFGEEEFKKVSIRNIVIKIISVVCVFIFVKKETDLLLYTFIMVMGYIIGYIFIWRGIKKYVTFSKIDFLIIKKHFIPCLIMLIPVLSLNIYRSMDKVMLGAISGMSETGIYENGEKLIYCLSSLISSLGTVMMPKISYLVEKKDESKIQDYIINSLKYMMILTSVMSFGLMAISDNVIIFLFGNEFAKSSVVLFLCAPTLIFMGWSNVIRTQYIIPHKKDDIYIKSITFGCLINLFVNFLLIPKLSVSGAVIGTLIAELSVPLYQFIRLKKELPFLKYIKAVYIYPIIGLVMLIVLKIVQKYIGISTLTMFIQIFLGGIIYIGLVIFYIIIFDKDLKKIILDNVTRKGKRL